MKTIIVTFFTIISVNVFANSERPPFTFDALPDEVIAKINASKEITVPMFYYDGDACWSASGTVECHPPCGGGSSMSTGCQESSEAAHAMAGTLAGDICGSCGVTVSYEVNCSGEDC